MIENLPDRPIIMNWEGSILSLASGMSHLRHELLNGGGLVIGSDWPWQGLVTLAIGSDWSGRQVLLAR